MKILKYLKYLIKPVMFVTFLCVILATLYFRSVLFHGNVNHYMDSADSYLEQQFKIDIPEYIAETNIVIPVAKVNDSVSSEQDVDELNSVVVSSEVSQPVVDQLDVSQPVVDQALETVVDAKEDEAALIEEKSKLQQETVVDLVKYEENLNLIKQLSETVDALNKKVDSLIDQANVSKNVVVPDEQKQSVDVVSNEEEQKQKQKVKALPSVDEVDEKAVSRDADVVSNDAREILLKARQMFWNGNPQGSEKLYLDLMTISDDDPDVYGELGNVYYAQGKWTQAGKAYYEAAIRLLELKKNDQVSYLLRVIQGLDSESANKLRDRLKSRRT